MSSIEYVIIIIILIIVLPSEIDCFYFHFKRTFAAVIHSPTSPYLDRFSSPRYTKTHGLQPIDLVNSITIIVIIIIVIVVVVVVVIIVVWCSVVMREKHSLNFSFNSPAVIASLLYIVAYIHTTVYIPEHLKLTFNHVNFLFK